MSSNVQLSHRPLLQMTDIRKRFGATQALAGVSLSLERGTVLALIGENGAGKSTLMKVLSGALAPDDGQMTLDGQPYAPVGPPASRRAGVAMIYQELNLAPDLSIEDNIMLGGETSLAGWLHRRPQRQRVQKALDDLGHGDLDVRTKVHRLSVGLQQIVEIARTLVFDARLIVFDEPTSSLGQGDVERLFSVIRRLKQSGRGIIYISHFLEEIRQIGDRYAVLRDGRSVGTGEVRDTRESDIVSLMVGRNVSELFPSVPHRPGNVLLTVNDLSGRKLPRHVSLEVRRGEILGIAGLVGAGRTEFLRSVFALDPVRTGQVRVTGKAAFRTPRQAIARGLGLVSEDRKGEGLAQSRSIADNLTLSRLSHYRRWGLLALGRRRKQVTEHLARLEVKAASPEQPVHELSGGNQQKVALARVLHQDADVLLLDEPTRGIDVGTKAQIYRLIGEAAAGGKAVIFVSSSLSELLAICDRIAVLARGRLRDIQPRSAWTEERLLAAALDIEEGSGSAT